MLIRLPAGAFPRITKALGAINFKCPLKKMVHSIKKIRTESGPLDSPMSFK